MNDASAVALPGRSIFKVMLYRDAIPNRTGML